MNEGVCIPIQISVGKLLEWLINRRHCKKDWQKRASHARNLIEEAVKDMPANDNIKKLLSSPYLNYFHCLKIVEILKETEPNTMNLFGSYGYGRLRNWGEIIRAYKKDNAYLAETAQILIRNVTYDIPDLKKQIRKLKHIQADLERKETKYAKLEKIAQNEFETLCSQLGISGKNIELELTQKAQSELPDIYAGIVEKAKSLVAILNFYSEFAQYTLGKERSPKSFAPIIKYVTVNGNTEISTCLNYLESFSDKKSSANTADSAVSKSTPIENGGTNEEKIKNTETKEESSLDKEQVSVEKNNEDEGKSSNEKNTSNEETCSDKEQILVMESSSDGDSSNERYLESENFLDKEKNSNEEIDIIAIEKEKPLTILESEKRNDFINELFELEAFLKMRSHEFKEDSKTSQLSFSHMQEVPASIQLASLDSIESMLRNIQDVISTFTGSKVQHLHLIQWGPSSYVETLASTLKQKLNQVANMKDAQVEAAREREEAREKASTLLDTLNIVIESTKQIIHQMELDISKRYLKRPVQLTGYEL